MSKLKFFFRRHAFRFYDPAQEQLQHALQTTLSAAVAIVLTFIFHWPESPWLILAAVFTLQIKPTTSLTQKISLQGATGVIASLMSLLAWKTKKFIILKIIVISLAGFLMVIAGAAGQQFAIAGLFIVIWTIIAYGSHTVHPYQRAILLLAGTSIAIVAGLIPLTRMQYRLRNTKANFWYSCFHYWQERILTTPNPLYCHNYRFHLLTCLDKLRQSLTVEQSQAYAFCFELVCDVLLHRDNLLVNYGHLFHVDINNTCHLISELFSPHYMPQHYQNLIHTLHHIQHQVAQRHQLPTIAKEQLTVWINTVDILAKQIGEVRKNDIA
jgi:hypothetical protein